MKLEKYIKIEFENKIYQINLSNLLYVLSKLTDKNLDNVQEKEILKLMKKYGLFDEVFLNNINDLRN